MDNSTEEYARLLEEWKKARRQLRHWTREVRRLTRELNASRTCTYEEMMSLRRYQEAFLKVARSHSRNLEE